MSTHVKNSHKLSTSCWLNKLVTNLSTSWYKFVISSTYILYNILISSCWDRLAARLLQVCYNSCVFYMCTCSVYSTQKQHRLSVRMSHFILNVLRRVCLVSCPLSCVVHNLVYFQATRSVGVVLSLEVFYDVRKSRLACQQSIQQVKTEIDTYRVRHGEIREQLERILFQ